MTHKKEQGVPTPEWADPGISEPNPDGTMSWRPTQQVQVTEAGPLGTLRRWRDAHVEGDKMAACSLCGQKQAHAFDCPIRAINELLIESEAARSVPVAEGLREALESGMAYALARAALPTTTETSIEYAERLAPLVIESGFLSATPPDPAEGQEPAGPPATAEAPSTEAGRALLRDNMVGNPARWTVTPWQLQDAIRAIEAEARTTPEEPAVIDVERLIWPLIESYGGSIEIDNVQRFREHLRAARLSSGARRKGADTE